MAISTYTQAYSRNRNVTFRDRTSSRAKGLSLWETCPYLAYLCDREIGYEYFDDFTTFGASTGGWVTTNFTSGTAVVADMAGGGVTMDAGAATADQGVQIQLKGEAWLPATGKDMWYETTLAMTFPTKIQLFAGIGEHDTTIFATGENSMANHIGFEMGATVQGGASAGFIQFYGEKAGTRGTVADAIEVTSAVEMNLGFFVDGVTSVTPYINGVAGTALATANIPVAAMCLTFACLSEGTSQPVLTVNRVRAFQLR